MAGLFVLLVFLLSCEAKDKYVGVYQAQATWSARQGVIILELRASGDGLWRVRGTSSEGSCG
jgi:hypothetical protein